MKLKIGQIATAAAVVGFLGLGGATLASAQTETPSTGGDETTPAAPDTQAPAPRDGDRANCDHGSSGGSGEVPESSGSAAETAAV